MLLRHGEDCMTWKVAVSLDALHTMPPFHTNTKTSKKHRNKANHEKTCGVSQCFVLKTSSSSDFCTHCVHPAAVCLITSFSRSFSFTSSAPTSSSPTCAARSGTAGDLFLYDKNKMNFLKKIGNSWSLGVKLSCKIWWDVTMICMQLFHNSFPHLKFAANSKQRNVNTLTTISVLKVSGTLNTIYTSQHLHRAHAPANRRGRFGRWAP